MIRGSIVKVEYPSEVEAGSIISIKTTVNNPEDRWNDYFITIRNSETKEAIITGYIGMLKGTYPINQSILMMPTPLKFNVELYWAADYTGANKYLEDTEGPFTIIPKGYVPPTPTPEVPPEKPPIIPNEWKEWWGTLPTAAKLMLAAGGGITAIGIIYSITKKK